MQAYDIIVSRYTGIGNFHYYCDTITLARNRALAIKRSKWSQLLCNNYYTG